MPRTVRQSLPIPYADGHVTLRSNVAVWTSEGIRNDAQSASMQSDGTPQAIDFSYTNPANGQVRQVHVALSIRPAV